ncbi:hypothetical protein ACHQM5_004487 [Ranunculus cassubicifolius]
MQLKNKVVMEGTATPRDSWMSSIRQKLHQSYDESLHRYPPTIYRVPHSMRDIDVDAYEPRIISIGPYHRGKPKLEAMENHKWRYLNDFLSSNPKLSLEKCLDEMKLLEEETRRYYSEPSELNSEKFAEMMLLDGCFFVEFLLKLRDSSLEFIFTSKEVKEPLFNTMWILVPLVHDMLLLENQIPFLVPQRLFDLAKISEDGRCVRQSLVELHFFMFNCLVPLNVEIPPTPACSVHHVLHLFHTHLLPSPQYIENNANTHMHKFSIHLHNLFHTHFLPIAHQNLRQDISRPVSSERKAKSIPSVTELQDAGVKFQKHVKKVGSFMEIEFRNGVMKIPELYIYPNTITFFRNLVAFEQCYPNSKTHFTAYALFMDKFINTSKDIMVLKEQGILRHGLGTDEELAFVFNQFGNGVNFYYSKTYLSNVYEDVKCYYESAWHKWRASLMRDYFENPWAFLSLLGALVLLLLTIVQALYAVLSHYSK